MNFEFPFSVNDMADAGAKCASTNALHDKDVNDADVLHVMLRLEIKDQESLVLVLRLTLLGTPSKAADRLGHLPSRTVFTSRMPFPKVD